jgi:hypothetical protein
LGEQLILRQKKRASRDGRPLHLVLVLTPLTLLLITKNKFALNLNLPNEKSEAPRLICSAEPSAVKSADRFKAKAVKKFLSSPEDSY